MKIDTGKGFSRDTAKTAITALPPVLATYARLCPQGWTVTGDGMRRIDDPKCLTDTEPSEGELFVAQVYLKRSWIAAKTASQNSYWLKHEAERHVGMSHPVYVSNGALIRAALLLGLEVRPVPGSNNADVLVKRPPDWQGPWCERGTCEGTTP